MKSNHIYIILLLGLALLWITGCSGEDSSDAASAAVQSYFQALVNKDVDRLSNGSCAAWEPQSQLDLESFGAVETTLENPACQSQDKDGDYTIVTCTGEIRANYGAEVLTINLADRQYLALYEGDQWRMCGYR